MKDRLTSVQQIIISDLVKTSDYVYIYTIAKRLRLDIYTVVMSIKKLVSLNYVKEDTDNDLRVKVTPIGRQWFLGNSSYLLTKEKPWRKIPPSFIQHQINPNDFYVPVLRYLDKKFIKKYSKKGGNNAGG